MVAQQFQKSYNYDGGAFGLTLPLKVSLVILAKASDHLQARKELSRDGCLSFMLKVAIKVGAQAKDFTSCISGH